MKYKEYIEKDITKELLNSVKVGDVVKCNDWKRGIKVIGVTENFFLMATPMFKKTLYSVCCKRQLPNDKFEIGVDNLLFGHVCEYKFDIQENIDDYLNDFENGEIKISGRNYTILSKIAIKPA